MRTWNRVIHHSNAAHSHRHNFLHGRTHHRHGVRIGESAAASEQFLVIYRAYYLEDRISSSTADCSDGLCPEGSTEQYMLSRSPSACVMT